MVRDVTNTTNGYLPRSLLLQWHITERCDHSCRHCYQEGTLADLPFDTLLTILEQFRSLLARLCSESPHRIPAHITISGGEPFLRDDFFDLLQRLHDLRREFSFAILTSGSLIDAATAMRLKLLAPKFVQVSLEGKKETHDSIRGRGDFERVLAAIHYLKKAGVPVLISFTAHRGNFREFGQVAAIGRKLGVKRVWADRFVPLGGAASQRDLVLTPQETDDFLGILATANKKRPLLPCPTEVATLRALQFRAGGGKPYRCQAGRELLTVMADGTLAPCRRMPLLIGNLLEDNLSELYFESPLLRELREDKIPTECGACFYRELCGGGLRCLSQAMQGSFNLADPGCSMLQHPSCSS
ncbi:MAG: radical SAM protein [Deltaproteobacteria bacterium]|nr:radical SAM protein [Deltaproteobacteria bacterium]